MTDWPSAAGFGSLVIVAPLVGRYGPSSLVGATRALLSPFDGSAFVLGAGIGNLGPIDYLTASLDRPTGPRISAWRSQAPFPVREWVACTYQSWKDQQ